MPEGITIVEVPISEALSGLLDSLVEQMLREAKEEDDQQYEGWYCINISPVTCGGCGRQVVYFEPPDFHLIIVWEDKDDERMLNYATKLKEINLDPEVREYHPMFGSCIPWEEVAEMYDRA